jgi:hypothetical protein
MATRRDIRRLLIDQTGRNSLVVDAIGGNYADNGADFHINAGLAFLDDRLPTPSLSRMFSQRIHTGQQTIYMPDCRSAEQLIIVDESVECILERDDDFYSRCGVNQEETLTPSRYTIEHFDGQLPFNAEVLVEDDDASGNDSLFAGYSEPGWGLVATTGADVDLSDIATLSLDTAADTTALGTFKIAYGDPDVDTPFIKSPFRKITVTFTLSSALDEDVSSFILRVRGNDSMEPAQIEDLSALADGRYSYTFNAESENGFVYVTFRLINGVGAGDSSASISDIRVYTHCTEAVRLSAPSDGNYDLYAYGRFLNRRLVSDYDSNWWTNEYPQLVVRAAKASIEGQLHRNETGERGHIDPIVMELRQIYMNRFVRPRFGGKPLSRMG